MFMQKGAMLYEGKAKKVFATDEPQLVIVEYKDARRFQRTEKGQHSGKGSY